MIFYFARLRMHSLFIYGHSPVEIPSVALGSQLCFFTFSFDRTYSFFTLCCA
jgi:hypothetical protein